MKDDFQV